MYRPIAFSTLAAALGSAALFVAASGSEARAPGGNDLDGGIPITAGWQPAGSFNGLIAAGPDTVRFETGPAGQVRAEGDPRALERLRFLVENGNLIVGRRSARDNEPRVPAAVIHVTGPRISAATMAGSGAMRVDRLSGNAVRATLAGSGTMAIAALDTRDVSASVAGSGALALSGRSKTAKIVVAGSGRFDGNAFETGSASTVVTGAGSTRFRSSGPVSVTITGSGTVAVTGGAQCTLHKIGSGTLRCGG